MAASETEFKDVEKSKYQKPLVFNKLLPYSDCIEDEANDIFKRIKENLSIAVQKRELWPGSLFWTNRLSGFLRVYGLHFTKEDHIKLVNLLFHLVTIPNLESPLLQFWCSLLSRLLKKKHLLSPDDIQLPWRPIYELVIRISDTKLKRLGMKIYSDRTINSVKQLISNIRCYFPIESTKEMLEEWKPLLCPFDTAMLDGMDYFGEFLPTLMFPEHFNHGYKLWFDELLHIWLESRNNNQLDEVGLRLFSRLSKDTIGHIDWSPYLSQIFTRILNNFELPMGIKEFQAPQTKKSVAFINGDKITTLIVSMLGGGSPTQSYLDKLMMSLESYYHPSNIGYHTKKLLKFLQLLTTKFVLRLKKERHKDTISWEPQIPQHARLSENDIDSFVQCLLPSLRLAIFSKIGTMEAAITVQNIALIRPEMVLPDLMEKTYTALETLTEPHQVVSTLSCATTVSRTLLSSWQYPEGRGHLFMLLKLALPGIDPNDFRKMLASSLLISSLTSLVPLVDCSSAIGHVEMNESEVEICSQTSQFEEFVVHLLERCFLVIENSGIHQEAAELGRIVSEMKLDAHETLMGAGIAGSMHAVLAHCSPQIFQTALDKLFHFATSHVFESEVAGKMCAEMCGSASKVNPIETLKKFIPHCTTIIENILEDPEQFESENPDVELIWNLQLLSHIVGTEGDALLPYADSLLHCLKLCIHLKSKIGSKHAAKTLMSILFSLTQVYPTESRITSLPLDIDPKEHLYTKDWSSSCHIDDTNIHWHISTPEEYQLVDRVLREILGPELDRLKNVMEGKITLDRDSLMLSLQLVDKIVHGASAYLPHITGPPVTDGCPESVVPLERGFYLFSKTTPSPPPEFSRQQLSEFFHKFKAHLMEKCEDHTKSLVALTQIIGHLLISYGSNDKEFEARWNSFKQTKFAMGNKLYGRKQLIRPMIIARCHLQHELRVLERNMTSLTPLHLILLEDLVDLSVSAYSEVRIAAQHSLAFSLDSYMFSSRKLLPKIIPYLQDNPDISHEQFKGSLYLLLSPSMTATIVHDWQIMRMIYPVLIRADHSEKLTILNLVSHLHNSIQKTYDTFSIKIEVSDCCLPMAAALGSSLTPDELKDGVERLEMFNKKSTENYIGLIEDLVEITEGQRDVTQWRFTEISVKLLAMLIRHDYPYPIKGVQLLVNYLVHDALTIRKVAIFAVTLLLQQMKRPHKKVAMDIEKLSGVGAISNPTDLTPGEREDNKWLCLNEDIVEDEINWNSNKTMVNKTRNGYYCYPRTLYGYAPINEQPKLDRTIEEMSESEQIIFKAFTDTEYVEKLISFLSMEENKGSDKYSIKRAQMFKNLFRNYGNSLANVFRPHLEKLAVDSQESSQRCASEIIAGLIRSTNHWSYNMVMELRSWLEPLLRKSLSTIQQETVEDWAQCFSDISADRDPQRIRWVLEVLLEHPLSGDNGSFIDSSRLLFLHMGLAQQEWRIPSVLYRMSSSLVPHLGHPFKNVRDRIGMVLSGIYMMDVSAIGFKMLYNPRLSELLQVFSNQIPPAQELVALPQESTTLKVCKTAMSVIVNCYQPSAPQYYQLFSMLLPLAAYEGDDEVGFLVKAMCIQLSRRELTPETIPIILESLKKATLCGLWKVKVQVLLVLQVLVFWNYFTSASFVGELVDLLLSLMEDSQIEVRELASSTISGLVRCGYISNDKLKPLFTKKSKTKLVKRSTEEVDSVQLGTEGHLVRRHCGVLGLAALVQACPYTVPDWLPEVVDELSTHLHDPAPIPSTVKKALSDFKRTHHDNWREHKLKFTEDQLSSLSDLLVSPSYYV